MISVVCVYNSQRMLDRILGKGLKTQNVEYELIALDNREDRFKSAAEALNYGGERASGEYIMFAHQDMWLGCDTWLQDAERLLKTIPNLGVAGVAGASANGSNWDERCRHSLSILDDTWTIAGVETIEEVQTLDECLLLVPRAVFSALKFDAEVFDGWDCYAADYCLAVKTLGRSAYVIQAGDCSHCTSRGGLRPWEFRGLLKYQKALHRKYRHKYTRIHCWMGTVSRVALGVRELLGVVGPILGPIKNALFPDYRALIHRALSDCDSLLDLGCGHRSPIQTIDVPYSVGVELSDTHMRETQRLEIHSAYVSADIRNLEFKPDSFDTVIALNVFEYLTKQEGADLLERMQCWAAKTVLIRTPNTPPLEHQLNSEYKSTWEPDEFTARGYRVRGSAGWKRVNVTNRFLQQLLIDITQRLAYFFPRHAGSLLASYRID